MNRLRAPLEFTMSASEEYEAINAHYSVNIPDLCQDGILVRGVPITTLRLNGTL